MSKDGVYSPFKPINAERDFGVEITDRYALGQHSKNFIQDPVTTWFDKETPDKRLIHYGWSFEPDDAYMNTCHHSWSMSKLYHTYADGSNFKSFWSTHSTYCEPTRALYYIRHGGEFPDLLEMSYGGYENELFEVFTDGKGGFILTARPEGSVSSEDSFETVLKHGFSLDLSEVI